MAKSRTGQPRSGAKKTRSRKPAKPSEGPKVVLEQWIEVRIRNGRTVTELYPGNEQLLQRARRMEPLPDLVYRRLNFPEGVPLEYDWTGADENMRKYGGVGVQRMEFTTWLEVTRKEQERADGHVGPTGRGNLPRPKERGGCECPVCRRNAGTA